MIHAENVLICIAVPLMLSLLFVRDDARRFVVALLLGMVTCLLSAYISGFINVIKNFGASDTAIFVSPVVEEAMKFIPLLLYLFLFEPKIDSLLLVSVGIGIGFSTFENSCYFLTTGEISLTFVLIRGMAVGVMHLISSLILALGLALIRRKNALSLPFVTGVLSLSVTLHALYNLLVSKPGLTSYIGYALPMLAAGVAYIFYNRFRHVSLSEEETE